MDPTTDAARDTRRWLDGDAATPLLKWAGGKRASASMLADAIRTTRAQHPELTAYVEPFCGALGAYLGVRVLGALDGMEQVSLTDANPMLIAVHRYTRDSPEVLHHALSARPDTVTPETYAGVRDAFNLDLTRAWGSSPRTSVAAAARLLWLNRACFNGLFRVNQSGEFNTPIGSARGTVALPSLPWITAVSTALAGADVYPGDYRHVRHIVRPSLIYCDPPYLGTFASYASGGFTGADHRRLASWCATRVRQGHAVLLSNADHPDLDACYPPEHGWERVGSTDVQYSVGATGERRGKMGEVLLRLTPR